MKKLYVLGAFFFVLFSCKNEQKQENVVEDASREIATQKWFKKTQVNSKAASILATWPEYNAFDTSFETLYDVSVIEDVTFVLEDLIEKQKLLSKSNYPEEYNIPQIKSRQKVVLTYMLKLKADLEYRLDIEESVLQLIEANNAMRTQFNVVVNNPLDNELILEDQLKNL